MWPVNLVEKTSRLKEYIKNLISEVNEFEQSLDNITVTAMRKSAIDEVEYAYKKVFIEVEEKKRFSYSSEIRIGTGYSDDRTTYFLNPLTISTLSIDTIDDFEIGEGIITVRVDIFNHIKKELITSIQKGDIDDQIHFTANHLIYNKIYEATTTKTEPEIPLVAGVFIDEYTLMGKPVLYTCPHCKAPVIAPYSKIDRELVCVTCSKFFNSEKACFNLYVHDNSAPSN